MLQIDVSKIVDKSFMFACSNKKCAFHSPFAITECSLCITERQKLNKNPDRKWN